MKKLKVVAGLWTETLTITILCLILGLGVGMIVAQPVTNVMLDQQITAAESASNNNGLRPVVVTGGQMGSDSRPTLNH